MEKRKKIMAIVVVLVLISIYPIYYYILPRSEVNLLVKYSECFLSKINLGAKFENAGTLRVEYLSGNITILNSTDALAGQIEFKDVSILPHEYYKPKPIQISGDHYETYYICVILEFYCGGTHYRKNISFHTKEPEQNQDWPLKLC
ncbi:MAG: hypothetical protein QXT63_00340 [Thermoplasmata archaeon]